MSYVLLFIHILHTLCQELIEATPNLQTPKRISFFLWPLLMNVLTIFV